MAETEQFIKRWSSSGNEKSDTQKFWLELLRDVLSLQHPEEVINFEKRVELEHISFIDGYIPSTGIIIEQKSRNINLDASAKQSDGAQISPFGQAKRYYDWLPKSEKGRFIIVCNFKEFRIHDMETPKADPEIIALEDLEREAHKLAFIVDPHAKTPKEIRELELSVKAGELVGKLYDSLLTRYINPDDKSSLRSLNVFCVRVVFLLYAEDSGLFRKAQFHDYLKARELVARDALRKLFEVLAQQKHERDPYLDDDLAAFPYVNGGLFEERDIELPKLDGEPLRIILEEMSEGFNWSGISPTIFGAVFESTINPETRHSGGMHYTSPENIHKVIDPLFMDDFTKEAEGLLTLKPSRARTKKLRDFQRKISGITFFDPACGSGNFLTETYLSLRKLENRIITELAHGQISFAFSREDTEIQVSISQFFGIEINDFAVAVARTALWIAEVQMWNETSRIVQLHEDVLPLKKYENIREANALFTDWGSILPKDTTLFIMGNPPFLGYSVQTEKQKQDIKKVFIDEKGRTYSSAKKVDYVAGWYFRASQLMQDRKLRAAFVSTSSLTQGEQVTYVFKMLHERFGINIDFAHTSFMWDSEAEDKAHVHVVVIGFDNLDEPGRLRRLYTSEGVTLVKNINFYLLPGDNVFAEAASHALSVEAKDMRRGSQPTDGGNLILTREEMSELIAAEPRVEKFIRPFMMGVDFIQRTPRYCLWLVDADPDEVRKCPKVMERVKAVREFRLASKKAATQRKAETPTLFEAIVESKTNYLAVPKVSSGERDYIPIDWLSPEVIPGDKLFIIPDATLYDFGILTSRIHMAWVRMVAGRLGTGYSYSNTIVYNTFAWPSPTPKQRAKIESSAQAILDARAKHPGTSFAGLYNDMLMPPELRKAHQQNDAAVCRAYGWHEDISEPEIVSRLFAMYYKLAGK